LLHWRLMPACLSFRHFISQRPKQLPKWGSLVAGCMLGFNLKTAVESGRLAEAVGRQAVAPSAPRTARCASGCSQLPASSTSSRNTSPPTAVFRFKMSSREASGVVFHRAGEDASVPSGGQRTFPVAPPHRHPPASRTTTPPPPPRSPARTRECSWRKTTKEGPVPFSLPPLVACPL
jgi:hypothetical protein